MAGTLSFLVQGVAALALLILLQLMSTFLAVRLDWYQRLIKSQPSLIFFKGEYLASAMRRQRVTREDILAAMRVNGFTEPHEVDAVVIETEGSLSILKNHAATALAMKELGVKVEELPLNDRNREADT